MRVLLLCGIMALTAFGFFPITETYASGVSTCDEVLDMPVLCMVSEEEACWLTLGAGTGVVVIGVGGIGVVCLTVYGFGLLFATGQIAAGGIALGQAGIGLTFFLGQVGGGLTALGQGVVGLVSHGQGHLGIDGEGFFKQLSSELAQILRFKPAPYPDDLP